MKILNWIFLSSLMLASSVAFAGPYEDGYRAGFQDGMKNSSSSCQEAAPAPQPAEPARREIINISCVCDTTSISRGDVVKTYRYSDGTNETQTIRSNVLRNGYTTFGLDGPSCEALAASCR